MFFANSKHSSLLLLSFCLLIWGATAQLEGRWLRGANGTVGDKAVAGGYDVSYGDGHNETLYVGRACFENNVLPGKIRKSHEVIYVTQATKEVGIRHYEYLIPPLDGDLIWKPASGGSIPGGGVFGGKTEAQENLYIGRADYHGSRVIGKVQPSHFCLYVPFNGSEIAIKDYEVLTIQRGPDCVDNSTANNTANCYNPPAVIPMPINPANNRRSLDQAQPGYATRLYQGTMYYLGYNQTNNAK